MITQIKAAFSRVNMRAQLTLAALSAFLFSSLAHAQYDIGGPDSGPLAAITEFVQDIVDFVDGPVALAFTFFSIVGMAITYMVAPKFAQSMGFMLRVIIGCIIILNVGVWIAAFQS